MCGELPCFAAGAAECFYRLNPTQLNSTHQRATTPRESSARWALPLWVRVRHPTSWSVQLNFVPSSVNTRSFGRVGRFSSSSSILRGFSSSNRSSFWSSSRASLILVQHIDTRISGELSRQLVADISGLVLVVQPPSAQRIQTLLLRSYLCRFVCICKVLVPRTPHFVLPLYTNRIASLWVEGSFVIVEVVVPAGCCWFAAKVLRKLTLFLSAVRVGWFWGFTRWWNLGQKIHLFEYRRTHEDEQEEGGSKRLKRSIHQTSLGFFVCLNWKTAEERVFI